MDYEKEIADFKKILDELLEVKSRKAKDYGNSWKIMGIEGIDFMIAKKFLRLWSLRNKIAVNEPKEDTYKDMAIYAIMALQLMRSGGEKSLMDELLNQVIIEQRNINL